MKRNVMQHSKTVVQGNSEMTPAQMLNSLRVRVLQAKGGFMAIGASYYMGLLEIQAAKEGTPLDADQKVKLRQVMNANLTAEDVGLVEFIERALTSQQAA